MDELPENWTYPLIQPKLIEKYLQIEKQSYKMCIRDRAYTEWVVVHRNLHVARLHFLGGEISETSEQKISSLLRLANLPIDVYKRQTER